MGLSRGPAPFGGRGAAGEGRVYWRFCEPPRAASGRGTSAGRGSGWGPPERGLPEEDCWGDACSRCLPRTAGPPRFLSVAPVAQGSRSPRPKPVLRAWSRRPEWPRPPARLPYTWPKALRTALRRNRRGVDRPGSGRAGYRVRRPAAPAFRSSAIWAECSASCPRPPCSGL